MSNVLEGRAVTERPILFSGAMVRAILDERKSVTRRAVNRLAGFGPITQFGPAPTRGYDWIFRDKALRWNEIRNPMLFGRCPYGQPGDRLWVRESHWRFTGCAHQGKPWEGFRESPDGDPYKAVCYDDYANLDGAHHACACVRVPSIHMPRWASRLTLEITGIRVERLQEISIDDVLAEGIERDDDEANAGQYWREQTGHRFTQLWDSINAARGYGWDANPWVWQIEFRNVEP